MAELLLADEWAEPSSLGRYLREALPGEYFVVVEITVHGCPLDAVVVGPQGLFVLHARDWEGEVRPARSGPWRERLASGLEVQRANPGGEARQATRALQVFLGDEFPTLGPAIRHLLVLTNPKVKLMALETTEPLAEKQDTVAETITSTQPPPDSDLLDDEIRETLALALRDRRLTTSQRASEPFTFRSGGLFGSGRKVWTVRAAVRHMDTHPEDGIFHLRNGTLAGWLAEQGAEHLAQLAREVMRLRGTDPRIPLETFLIGTGLVPRPRLQVRPRRINLGCVLVGETCDCRLRVQKGRGRGYLFGTLRTSAPWLSVDPRSFAGHPLVARVSADTEMLAISGTPWLGEIEIESSASEEPISVPVQVRVVGLPSNLNRYLLRPWAGLMSAGLIGAGLGWCLGRWGLPEPDWFAGLTSLQIPWAATLAILVGLLWALLGWIRGVLQPVAWPATYATSRWLLRTLAWGIAFSVLAAVGFWAWGQLDPDPGTGIPGTTTVSAILLALVLAIVPAVIGEVRSARQVKGTPLPSAGRFLRRPLLVAVIGVALALILAAAVPLLGPAWQQHDVGGTWASAQRWAGERWPGLETSVSDFVDRMYLRYRYGDRVLMPTALPATATPAPTLSPTTEGGTP